MTFPAYPQYKDSGIESLGEIPSHWDVTRLPYVIFENNAGEVIDKNFWGDGSELLYTCAKQPLLSDFRDFPARKRTGANDLLLTRNGTPYVHLPSEGAIYSNVVQRVSLIPGIDRKFMRSALDVATRDLVGYGVSITSFNYEMWAALRIPLPDYEEQTQIARFLDHETARIDALIEEQQRLIELLKEKRQAVISHAVTKGLDPTVPMKDSGVEWLGDVPVHWSITNIKRVGAIRYGIGEPPQYYPEGMPLIRATNVHAGKLFSEGLVFVDPTEIPARRIVWLEPGDIIVVRSGAYTGDSAIIPDDYGQCIAGFDMVLRCHSAQPSFIQFALLSKYLKEGQLDLEKMRAAQPHLNAEELGACMLVLPAMEEQIKIVEFLQTRCSEFDILTTEAERAKSLLQERRSALISAAVTGKIDVRGRQPATHTQAPESAVAEAV